MQHVISRRMTFRLGRGMGLGLGLAASGGFPAMAALGTQPLALPDGPMRLERVLVRGLAGGDAITITRTWEVAFAPQGSGIAINGVQVSAAVDAPSNLAALARIEEERPTLGMFPILLDRAGTILAIGDTGSHATFTAAVAEAEKLLAASAGQGSSHREILGRITNAGSSVLEQMPSDLFFPATQPIRQVREIALADGDTGVFELHWEATRQPGTAWLASARRDIVTRIGASERRSHEIWHLDPA